MSLKQIVLIAFSFATLVASVNAFNDISHNTDMNLMSFMSRSNDLMQQDPARSLDCFNYYIPLINEIAKDYENNFKACLNESDVARIKADNATSDQRKDLANSAAASCALLSQCDEDESVEGVFQCYINGGAANIKTMYGINANASEELAALRESYYLIEAQEYKCTNETKRVYEKDSAEAYANLNSCILGISEIPTEGPPTTTVHPETTAVEPESSTATSDEPVTVTKPEETTTEETTTEETTTENAETTPEDLNQST